MISSWDSYYVIFLSALISLIIPASLELISFLFFQKKPELRTLPPFKSPTTKVNQTVLGQRFNIRFFLAANAALILITLALELIPCVTALQSETQVGVIKSLIAIITLAGFSVLGLLYSIRKGDMGWLSSFQKHQKIKMEKKD